MSSEQLVCRLGNLHSSLHNDGALMLERILKTVGEMLLDRSYQEVTRAPRPLEAIDEGRPVYESEQLDVYMHIDDKVGVKFTRQVLERERNAIIVSIDGPTTFAKKECDGRVVQFLHARTLLENVTHHKLVPRHERILALPEGLTAAQIPKLLDTDPIVLYHNWPPGTLVRITRIFGGHQPTVYFRAVAAT
mgnify:CR=1 FL=1